MYLGNRSAIGSLFDLEGHDFVLFASDGGDEVWALDGPKGMVEIRANGRLAVKGPHAELAALSGLGIALLPDAMTASHIRAGRLAHVLPELARKSGSLNLVYPSGRHRSAALRQLIEFVVMKMGCA